MMKRMILLMMFLLMMSGLRKKFLAVKTLMMLVHRSRRTLTFPAAGFVGSIEMTAVAVQFRSNSSELNVEERRHTPSF